MYIEDKEEVIAWAAEINSAMLAKDAAQAMFESIPGSIYTCRKCLAAHSLNISDRGCEYYGEYVISRKSKIRIFVEGFFN